jgi:hypothetical protein
VSVTRPRASIIAAVAGLVIGLTALLSGCGGQRIPPTRPVPGVHVGIVANTLALGATRSSVLAGIRATGVRWIREEFDWPAVEPSPGERRWGQFDALMVAAAGHGLQVLPVLLGTPTWAGSAPLGLPDDPAAFGAFAGRVAARYGPGGSFWRAHPRLDGRLAPRWFELWNEPYFAAFSTGGIDPARYAQMVQAATSAGRAANPRTRWLMEADLTYVDAAGVRRAWLDALYAAVPDLNADFDGVALHPYSFYGPTATAANGVATAFRFDRIATIERSLAQHGAPSVPLWITEIGWSTCSQRPGCVSEDDQARRLHEIFALVGGRYRNVRAVFVYRQRDGARPPGDRESHYGLVRADGSRKPAWSVLRDAARPAPRGSSRSAR